MCTSHTGPPGRHRKRSQCHRRGGAAQLCHVGEPGSSAEPGSGRGCRWLRSAVLLLFMGSLGIQRCLHGSCKWKCSVVWRMRMAHTDSSRACKLNMHASLCELANKICTNLPSAAFHVFLGKKGWAINCAFASKYGLRGLAMVHQMVSSLSVMHCVCTARHSVALSWIFSCRIAL